MHMLPPPSQLERACSPVLLPWRVYHVTNLQGEASPGWLRTKAAAAVSPSPAIAQCHCMALNAHHTVLPSHLWGLRADRASCWAANPFSRHRNAAQRVCRRPSLAVGNGRGQRALIPEKLNGPSGGEKLGGLSEGGRGPQLVSCWSWSGLPALARGAVDA